jgi:hypothetical protein
MSSRSVQVRAQRRAEKLAAEAAAKPTVPEPGPSEPLMIVNPTGGLISTPPSPGTLPAPGTEPQD